jgi:hypothetical protein
MNHIIVCYNKLFRIKCFLAIHIKCNSTKTRLNCSRMYSILVLGGVMVSPTSFGWKVKLLAPFRKISRHVKDPLRYVRDTDRRNHLLSSFSPIRYYVSLLQPEKTTMVDE